jgi:hypothetical protein
MDQEIVPFLIDVREAELTDLRRRPRQTRWPEPELVPDWSQGVAASIGLGFRSTQFRGA